MTAKQRATPRARTRPVAVRSGRAAATTAVGGLAGIEHIVIVMMENRSLMS